MEKLNALFELDRKVPKRQRGVNRAHQGMNPAAVRYAGDGGPSRLALSGCVAGIVTAPINKKAISLAGYAYPGHTELLADFTGSKQVGMMILGGPFKILFVTTHVAIRDLPAALTPSRILGAIRLANFALQKHFKLSKPRIGVAALNPHAGENGLFGDEERQVIAPASQQGKKKPREIIGDSPGFRHDFWFPIPQPRACWYRW